MDGFLAMWIVLVVAVPCVGIGLIVTRVRGLRAPERPRPLELGLLLASVAAAVTFALVVAFVPLGASQSTTISSDGFTESAITRVHSVPPQALVLCALTVLVAALPLFVVRSSIRPHVEVAAAFVLAGVSFITGFSIGLLLLPSAVLMALASSAGVAASTTSPTTASHSP